jgi:hypothetical protein
MQIRVALKTLGKNSKRNTPIIGGCCRKIHANQNPHVEATGTSISSDL